MATGTGGTLTGGVGGSSGEVEYNAGGAFGGASNFYYNSGTGYVGIGTTGPQNLLEIGGGLLGSISGNALALSDGSANSVITLGQSSSTRGILGWVYNSTASSAYFDIATAGDSNPVVLQPTGGNVGIGSAAPQALLDIGGQLSFGINGAQSGSVNRIAADGNTGWMTINSPGALYLNNETSANVNIAGGGGTTIVNSTLQTGNVEQAYGTYIWPGRNDGSGANYQTSWYLASNSSYGLYTNTGLYVAGTVTASSVSMGYERDTASCGGGTLCTATCSSGKQVLGGGCWLNSGWTYLEMGPTSSNSYSCESGAAGYDVTVYAICAYIQ